MCVACVYMCAVCRFVQVCVQCAVVLVHVCACGGQRRTPGILSYHFFFFTSYSLKIRSLLESGVFCFSVRLTGLQAAVIYQSVPAQL